MQILVTGAGGFLGGAITRRLLAKGHKVRSLTRGAYPELEDLGVETHRGDVGEEATVLRAVQGCEVVFHVAAKIGAWGPHEDYFKTNVQGTRHILAACKAHGTRALVYTSTPSVIHAGGDVEGIDESAPYPTHFDTHYPATKAMAEAEVLRANSDSLRTVALRPHLIWGPGDTQLIPRLIARAKAGRLRLIGGGKKLIDSVYIDNAALAHTLAMEAVLKDAPACAGKPYFITQGEPVPTHELINKILRAAGQPPVTRSVSPKVAWAAGALLEGVYKVLRKTEEPPMTRFVAHQLATAHWYDISAARKDLGYQPEVSLEEGLRRLEAWFTNQST